jgi:hypothetical protein
MIWLAQQDMADKDKLVDKTAKAIDSTVRLFTQNSDFGSNAAAFFSKMHLDQNITYGADIFLLVIGILFICLLPLIAWLAAGRASTSNPVFIFTHDRMHISYVNVMTIETLWKAIPQLTEHKKWYVITDIKKHAYYLPKNAFTAEQQNAFKELLTNAGVQIVTQSKLV